jgi:putative addiction module CopG family antidote
MTTVSLGEHFERFIKDQIAHGRYNNASEIVREALHNAARHGRATQAVVNGVMLKVDFQVTSISSKDDVHIISSNGEAVEARWVINAAGLYSDDINNLFGYGNFKVTPRRGELIIYDKLSRRLVNHVLLPVPTATTKGVLVSPTIYGNILLGPTAEDLPDKTATKTLMVRERRPRDRAALTIGP